MNTEEHWDQTAESYLNSTWHSNSKALDRMVRFANWSGGKLLDIATGAGHAAFAFSERVHSVVATDTSQGMLDIAGAEAKSRGIKNISFEIADAMNLPFENQSFDWVVCRVAAHHFSDPEQFLREVKRVMKLDGEFLLIDTTGISEKNANSELDRFEKLRDPSHISDYSTFEWMNMIDSVGFKIIQVETQPKPLQMKEWLDRTRVKEPTRTEIINIVEKASGKLLKYFKPEGKGEAITFHLNETSFLINRL